MKSLVSVCRVRFTSSPAACAETTEKRPNTWINAEIARLYTALHVGGAAHSVECWQGGSLVGGLYGVSIGGAFFGESMFSRKLDASKIALVYLVTLMNVCGFTLLDTQFQTSHLQKFGTYEITRANYHHLLNAALKIPAKLVLPPEPSWDHLIAAALQPINQIS